MHFIQFARSMPVCLTFSAGSKVTFPLVTHNSQFNATCLFIVLGNSVCCVTKHFCHCRLADQKTSAVFLYWRQHVQRQRRNDRLVSQRMQHASSALLFEVMSHWRQLAQTRQKGKALVARCQRTHATHLLQQGLLAFLTALEAKHARAAAADAALNQAKVSSMTAFKLLWCLPRGCAYL